jgi:hypothetical protein
VTKTFLLGVGCQKGGTTWLHRYLTTSPQFVPGYRKEFHVFDSLHLPPEEESRRRLLTQAANHAANPRADNPRAAGAVHRLSMFLDPQFYFDYFTGLLHRSPEARLVADVTPAYSMLPTEVLEQIREGFGQRGITTLPVFVMRDPVERIWSHIRMQARVHPEHEAAQTDSAAYLLAHHAQPEYASRTAYDETIRKLDSVFGPEQVFYSFYERLFTDTEVRRLCDRAGIDFVDPSFDQRHNSSPSAAPLSDETTRTVAEHYAGVYRAVAERFPDVSVPDLWPSSRFVL